MRHTPHPFVISDGGADVDWTHPTDCPDGDQCEIHARTQSLRLDDMAALAAGRPDGTYHLGLYGWHALVLIDDHGHILPDPHADAA